MITRSPQAFFDLGNITATFVTGAIQTDFVFGRDVMLGVNDTFWAFFFYWYIYAFLYGQVSTQMKFFICRVRISS